MLSTAGTGFLMNNSSQPLRWQPPDSQDQPWQQALKDLINDPQELLALLKLDTKAMPTHLAASQSFPVRVPRQFVAKMQAGNWQDPLLLQVLPQAAELKQLPGYTHDPLAEQAHNPHPGLIHKYPGRVLLIISGGCAINCRYCFRRHFPYADNNPSRSQWQQTLHYIANDPSIKEVIFSGGDPLVATDKQLAERISAIAEIEHVTTIRIHSRLPVVIPSRITDQLIQAITHPRLKTVFVIHSNHANELDNTVAKALSRLRLADITLLNQSVLLAGINDNTTTLKDLSERLFQLGVFPYYLHVLDKVQGAGHFEVSDSNAKQLIDSLRNLVPGYLVPKLVRETPNAASKTPV